MGGTYSEVDENLKPTSCFLKIVCNVRQLPQRPQRGGYLRRRKMASRRTGRTLCIYANEMGISCIYSKPIERAIEVSVNMDIGASRAYYVKDSRLAAR
jgi:hypothetical protein